MPSSFRSSLSDVLQNGYCDFVFGEYRNHRAIELISSQQFRNFSLHLTDSLHFVSISLTAVTGVKY